MGLISALSDLVISVTDFVNTLFPSDIAALFIAIVSVFIILSVKRGLIN